VRIVAGGQPVARLVSTYNEMGPGEVCALFGSSDHLELAVNARSAEGQTGGRRGTRIEVRRN
jgi:S-adenosylmethionine hydrolase